jgi:hypothetical protein
MISPQSFNPHPVVTAIVINVNEIDPIVSMETMIVILPLVAINLRGKNGLNH